MSDTQQKIARVLAVIFAALLVVTTMGPLWWWAIVGMDTDVGVAWMMTACLVAVILIVAFGVGWH